MAKKKYDYPTCLDTDAKGERRFRYGYNLALGGHPLTARASDETWAGHRLGMYSTHCSLFDSTEGQNITNERN